MNRLWSLLFLTMPVAGVAALALALRENPVAGFGLPEAIGPRAGSIDRLMNQVHILLGFVFLGTGVVLASAIWLFPRRREGNASRTRGNTLLEIVWTAIPAAILGFLAFYQAEIWEQNKTRIPTVRSEDPFGGAEPVAPFARVIGRQYEWIFVYPGGDGEYDTWDDIQSPGVLKIPVDTEVVLELSSADVIHSFAINALRLKQDVVPGLRSSVWFTVTKTGRWEINCTELCGWGHYRMTARLEVMPEEEFASWFSGRLLEVNGAGDAPGEGNDLP